METAREPGAKRTHRVTLLWWLITVGWAAVIFGFSADPESGKLSAWLLTQGLALLHLTVSPATFGVLHFLLRKSAHATEYAIFSLLLYRSIGYAQPFTWRRQTALWSLLVAGLYALTDEFHQGLVRGRGASLLDCGIDTAGAALALLVVYARDLLLDVGAAGLACEESPRRPA